MNRAQMLYALEDMIDIAKSSEKNNTEPAYFVPQLADLTDDEKANSEYDYLGFFISSHPLDSYRIKLSQLESVESLAEKEAGSVISLGGLMMDILVKQTKKGSMMGFFTLEDMSGRCEVVVFPKTYDQYKEYFTYKNFPVEIKGKLEKQVREFDDEEIITNKIILLEMEPLEHAQKLNKVIISLIDVDQDNYYKIKELLDSNPGDVEVEIEYRSAIIKPPVKVDQTKKFLKELEQMCNIQKVYAA